MGMRYCALSAGSLILLLGCESVVSNASAEVSRAKSAQGPALALNGSGVDASEGLQLKDSVDTRAIEGVAGAPSPEGKSTSMDVYAWDASGNRKLLQLTKAPVNGLVGDIYYTKNHIFFQLSSTQIAKGSKACSVVVLTKQTGVIHCLANLWISKRIKEWAQKQVIQTDDSGDRAVFLGFDNGRGGYEDLYTLDFTGGTAELQVLHADNDTYHRDYDINANGEVLHRQVDVRGGRNDNFMLSKAGSTSVTIGPQNDAAWANCITRGVGSNALNFYAVAGTGGGGGTTLDKFTRDASGNFTKSEVIPAVRDLDYFSCQYVLRHGEFVYFFGLKQGVAHVLFFKDAVASAQPEWSIHEVRDMIKITSATADINKLYILGEDKMRSGTVLSMDKSAKSFSTLIPHHKYLFHELIGPFGGQLIFTGERMSDSAYVNGRVNVSTGADVLTVIDVPAVRNLIPLN